ncbi:hypothetical protein JTB14_019173 [Gonioctena quinquepunctata]|nr:hypothetical protein JTB14_002126 [Gonioctena quinquepunctata]KAG5880250.1 hypothetical protein JTB14_019173 [Gonioctena quinquepunctata]
MIIVDSQMANPTNNFKIKSANVDFNLRQKNVFDQLKVLENNRKNNSSLHNGEMEVDDNVDGNRRNQRSLTKQFRGKESIFKKPQNPVPKNFIRSIPDFKKNPHKWTKYSLEDVNEDDISDKSNTKAALSFLKELEERKRDVEFDDESTDLTSRIIFHKRTCPKEKTSDLTDPEATKSSFKSSKVIMPEYIVGQKEKKERRNRTVKNLKEKELKLYHLLENEDE